MPKIMQNIWSLPRYKKEWRNICALLPIYLSDGTNGSYILYEDGSVEEIKASLSWLLDDLLAYLHSNKQLLLRQSRRITAMIGKQRGQRLPLLLDGEFCLVPVKSRTIFREHHDVSGYVRLNKVEDFSEQKGKSGCKLWFTNQLEVEVLDNMRTLRGNMALAAEMTKYLREIENLA